MITAITVFAVSFVLMVSLMNEHRYSIGESAYQPMLQDYPASILAAGIVALTFYLCWAIWKERYKYNHSLSYWSVNEAVDDVPCGVCFSDSLGRIVLCNTKMQELSRIMTGSPSLRPHRGQISSITPVYPHTGSRSTGWFTEP